MPCDTKEALSRIKEFKVRHIHKIARANSTSNDPATVCIVMRMLTLIFFKCRYSCPLSFCAWIGNLFIPEILDDKSLQMLQRGPSDKIEKTCHKSVQIYDATGTVLIQYRSCNCENLFFLVFFLFFFFANDNH